MSQVAPALADHEAVILSAVRTPTGKYGGALAELSAPALGSLVVAEAVKRAGVTPQQVDEVILGCVIQAGLGQNPARQAAIRAGIPAATPAFTVNKVCASGLKAVILAAQAVKLGDAGLVVAGGMESMSNAPYLLDRARFGYRIGHGQVLDADLQDGLWDAFKDIHMGMTAELVADRFGITRQDQDAHALESHRRAVAAADAGYFDEELLAVEIPRKKGEPIRVTRDEPPRRDTSLEKLARLAPAFKEGGTVTAGNAPGLSDGASALVVTSARTARELGLTPLAVIRDYASAGLEPEWVMMAPVEAVAALLARHPHWSLEDFDLVELNEAFSAQALAVMRRLGLDPARVNVNGGAVALGHAIGSSGARILVTLVHALRAREKERGLATLCLGGGMGVALALESAKPG